MKTKGIRLASLNVWRFYDWQKRLPEIVGALRKIKPDIIFLQEAEKDISFDSRNQADILAEALGYPFKSFAVAEVKTKMKGVLTAHPVDHGLGVVSVFPFVSETISLTQAPDDKEKRIVVLNKVTIGDEVYNFTNVHFSNSDAWAEAHFKETLKIFKDRKIETVLAGDFNVKNMSSHKNLYGNAYTSSADLFKYVSYPKDATSYDYVLLPKGYAFKNFECRDEEVSDHRLIVADIILPE